MFIALFKTTISRSQENSIRSAGTRELNHTILTARRDKLVIWKDCSVQDIPCFNIIFGGRERIPVSTEVSKQAPTYFFFVQNGTAELGWL